MRIEHIAIWTRDLEKIRDFYQTYFNMKCSAMYENSRKGFTSYFLSFGTGTRVEIMKRKDISEGVGEKGLVYGLTHIAISLGDKEEVDKLTDRLRSDGVKVLKEPGTTGDGYYESVILDPEGNHIEITE
ncbi:MAG TPA: VOC family protein [Bacteroidales bacterium]|nr:VOC family protein [Bacteroidales bacterium]